MHFDATAAARGGQGRRLRKQMGCKVGSGGLDACGGKEAGERESRRSEMREKERRLCPGRTQVSV